MLSIVVALEPYIGQKHVLYFCLMQTTWSRYTEKTEAQYTDKNAIGYSLTEIKALLKEDFELGLE